MANTWTAEGYHSWPGGGSFEVFFEDESQETGKGFYWWPCHPGCLPDGDASGPFNTSREAYDNAVTD